MIRVGSKDLKIFRPVIRGIIVFMMDDLIGFQISPEHLLGDKSMFTNPAAAVGHGMIWLPDQDVAALIDGAAVNPIGVLRAGFRT
jgi:hypothetical protein